MGSSPPSTAQIHATIGTGAFSHHHGIVAHHFRIGETLTEPWSRGPGSLILPTIGDVYDQARDNEPLVGAIATVAIHLGMLGHGSFMTGGDRDLAVTREIEGAATLGAEGVRWRLTGNVKPYYDFPAYVNRLPRISNYFGPVDRSDGKLDGAWHGHDLAGADTLGRVHDAGADPVPERPDRGGRSARGVRRRRRPGPAVHQLQADRRDRAHATR